MEGDAVPVKPIHVWVNPPDTPLPLTQSPVRVAVGTPTGPSTNSWRLWVQGDDIYVKCRDNFRELKASLHASGIWRFGFTEEFIRSRPNVLPEGKDRTWKKWQPSFADPMKPVIGFQIVALKQTLYLGPKDRRSWPSLVVFVEPPVVAEQVTVLSVTVVQSRDLLRMSEGTQGAVVAMLPLGEDRTVQLVATHEGKGNIEELIKDAFIRGHLESGKLPSDEGVFFVHGSRGDDIPWVTAVSHRRKRGKRGHSTFSGLTWRF